MIIIGIMIVGILMGHFLIPNRFQKYNSHIQLLSILLLIFAMGINLGQRPDFGKELRQVGVTSATLALLPMIGSALFVYGATTIYKKKVLDKRENQNQKPGKELTLELLKKEEKEK